MASFTLMLQFLVVVAVKLVVIQASQTTLPSEFYKTGGGIVVEISFGYVNNMHLFQNFPECPGIVQTVDKFEWVYPQQKYKKLYARIRSYFVSPQTGNHRFFVICKNKCQIRLSLLPGSPKDIITDEDTPSVWTGSKYSEEVKLLKGFRYLIEAFLVSQTSFVDNYLKLGVEFPDKTEVKPIDGRYLQRSMELYKWKGFLKEIYKPIQWPSQATMSSVILLNAAIYPGKPVSVTPCNNVYSPSYYQNGHKIAVRYTGYFTAPISGDHKFRMEPNDICTFSLTKSSTEKLSKDINKAGRQEDFGPIDLVMGREYLISTKYANLNGKDYLDIAYKPKSGSFIYNWMANVKNLDSSTTSVSIPAPQATVLNSTSLQVRLVSYASLPPKDDWSKLELYDIMYKPSSSSSSYLNISLTGSLPSTTIITGLKKYTFYSLYAHYYGRIGSSFQYNLISVTSTFRTGEDVPSSSPPNFKTIYQSSTVISLTWDTLNDPAVTHGIVVGYEVKYAIKNSNPKNWASVHTSGVSNRFLRLENLQTYTMYQFQVAAKTSKGAGVFSPILEIRTAESVPTSPPSNITAENTSSSSILVKWDDVAEQHKKGIITKYTVYLRKTFSSSPYIQYVVLAPTTSFVGTGLMLWTNYNVKVSASTNVGEGAISAYVTARTDEDKPGGPPRNVEAVTLSSSSIRLDWSEIQKRLTNGIIVSYNILYQRKDKTDALKNAISYSNTITVTGLMFFVEYDFRVAGMTKKGVGIYSQIITRGTFQDTPFESPTGLKGNYTSSTSIRVSWGLIPMEKRNGIIVAHNVRYRLSNSNGEWNSATVDSSTFELTVFGLETYSFYDFTVAGATSKGLGPRSSPVAVRTDADGPVRPPSNLAGSYINHTSINMTWSRVPKGFRSGIILGYKLRFKDATLPNAPWINATIPNELEGSGFFNKTLTGLKIYTPYTFVITAFTYRAEGVYSPNVTVWTDEFIPEGFPKKLSGENTTSTGITIQWKNIAEVDGDANGKVLGYRVRYQVTDCYRDRPEGCDENRVFNTTTADANPQITLPKLRKYTNYSITIQVFNKKGESNISDPFYVKTAEDKPDAPPTKLETWPGKSDSLFIYWSPIPESLRNGIIRSYRIFYKPIDVPLRMYNRAPRSVNPFAALGALPGEKMVEVNASMYHVEIADLKDYSWYHVRIGAVTSKGLGVTFSMNGTCKQGSPIAAPQFDVTGDYDFYEITVQWSEISRSSARGEVLGYRIRYWPIEINDLPAFGNKVYYIDVLAASRSLAIKNLQPFTKYGISISAFTEGGFGVASKFKPAETCKCPKLLHTSWMKIHPLVHGNRSMIMGILPKYIEEAVSTCCGNCSGGQGPSNIDWSNGGSNSSSLKYSMHGLRHGIIEASDIILPFFRDKIEVEGGKSSLYDYVPFVISPGMAVFKRKPSLVQLGNQGADNIASSVFALYPLLLVTVLLIIIAGGIFWYLERGDNTDEFPDDFFRGTGSGFWLAFITMTTAGYGDIAPKTIGGRIFAIIWTLVGIVLTSMMIGSLANALALSTIAPTITTVRTSSNGKTLASDETFMISTVNLRSKTVIGNTSDDSFVKHALLSENVSRVILEAYEAAQFKDSLEHPDIEFEALKKVDASYGVVLRGPVRRIKHCVSRYAQANAQRILEDLSEHRFTFKRGESTNTLMTSHLLSPDADITFLLNKYGGIMLLVMIFVGAIYDFVRWMRRRAKVEVDKPYLEKVFQQLNTEVENLVKNSNDRMHQMELRHAMERMKLVNMDIKDLKAIAPHLTIFDEDLRPKFLEHHPKKNRYEIFDEPEESDCDHPMDLKVSEH